MASVNRGLDRCATLLKCLLSPDSEQSGVPFHFFSCVYVLSSHHVCVFVIGGSQRREKNQNVGMAKRRIAGRHGNKVLMKQTKVLMMSFTVIN